MTTIIDQARAARALGLIQFDSATPCRFGHVRRYTLAGHCVACGRVEFVRRRFEENAAREREVELHRVNPQTGLSPYQVRQIIDLGDLY
jgi:hypothetical protein